MRNVTIDNVTDPVLASLGKYKPCEGRPREIIDSLLEKAKGCATHCTAALDAPGSLSCT